MESKVCLILSLIYTKFVHLFVTLQGKSYIYFQHLHSAVTPSIPHYRTWV